MAFLTRGLTAKNHTNIHKNAVAGSAYNSAVTDLTPTHQFFSHNPLPAPVPVRPVQFPLRTTPPSELLVSAQFGQGHWQAENGGRRVRFLPSPHVRIRGEDDGDDVHEGNHSLGDTQLSMHG